MRGVRNTEEGIKVLAIPEIPRDGVRVRVATSGICGSDVHLASFGPSAVTLGHEFCGRLDDGTPVAVLPVVACGTCDHCRSGQEQQCAALLAAMYGVSLDGGLADEVWVDPACAKPLPDERLLECACLVEPVAVALHGIHRAGLAPGARVLVVGAGPIGLCAIAVARSVGASVDLLAHRPGRIEAGARLGASTSTGRDYDLVVEAAGTQSALDTAIELVRPGGTVSIVGSYWEPVSIGLGFQMKEATILPSFVYGHHHGRSEFEDAIDLLAATPDLPETLITHRFALDDAAEAFRVAGDREAAAIKVALVP